MLRRFCFDLSVGGSGITSCRPKPPASAHLTKTLKKLGIFPRDNENKIATNACMKARLVGSYVPLRTESVISIVLFE
jgi:hypothetical protein